MKTVMSLYDASTTFNVAVQYLQCKHLAIFAQSRVHIIHKNSYFPHPAMKSRPVYYTLSQKKKTGPLRLI